MIYLPRQSLRKCRNLQVCHFSHFKLNVFILSNRGHRRWRQHCTTGRCGRRRNWVLAAASSVLSRKKQITPSPERSLGTNRSQGWRAVFCVHAKSIPFNAVSSSPEGQGVRGLLGEIIVHQCRGQDSHLHLHKEQLYRQDLPHIWSVFGNREGGGSSSEKYDRGGHKMKNWSRFVTHKQRSSVQKSQFINM